MVSSSLTHGPFSIDRHARQFPLGRARNDPHPAHCARGLKTSPVDVEVPAGRRRFVGPSSLLTYFVSTPASSNRAPASCLKKLEQHQAEQKTVAQTLHTART